MLNKIFTMIALGLIFLFSTMSAFAQDVLIQTPLQPDMFSQVVDLLGAGGMPGAAVAITYMITRVFDQFRQGGIPVHVELGFDQRSRRLIRQAVKLDDDDDDNDNF
jgi:hypothetical protein